MCFSKPLITVNAFFKGKPATAGVGCTAFIILLTEDLVTASIVDFKTHILDDNNFTVNGFYDFEVDNSNGERVVSHARFTFVFHKKNNTIKILSHHSSVMP